MAVIASLVKTARGQGRLLQLPHSSEGSVEKDVGQNEAGPCRDEPKSQPQLRRGEGH